MGLTAPIAKIAANVVFAMNFMMSCLDFNGEAREIRKWRTIFLGDFLLFLRNLFDMKNEQDTRQTAAIQSYQQYFQQRMSSNLTTSHEVKIS